MTKARTLHLPLRPGPGLAAQNQCFDHWESVGGSSWLAEAGFKLHTSEAALPEGFLEVIGHSPVHSVMQAKIRLDERVAGCRGGIYEPTSFFGFTYSHHGLGVTYPGPSLGLPGVVSALLLSSAGMGGGAASCSFYVKGVFASIMVYGGASEGALESVITRAARKL